ncbi:quinoprotein dehydrogenase-associated SoxYZ-like carrier [Palleronia sp.]|uniref:quinoprotein dehydrogenase-associated SoxYZ-like carrier n=1 Tax=Palleronia sp. TaxID=1940284 RepID=UPI0035C7CA09
MAAGLLMATGGLAQAASDAWSDIVNDVFNGRAMEQSDVVKLETPYRAEDAATVPVTMHFAPPEGSDLRVERVTLVIDENPAPVAAVFELGADAGVTQIETRVRVQSYTNVHLVAELSDGSLHMTENFVKASGGCSAPMGKDPEAALANLGQMKLRQFDGEQGAHPEAQLMIRHPNNSGLQMDQLTRYYIPAHFIHDLRVAQGNAPILTMEGGISLSEDPSIRFDFQPNGGAITVEAEDTEGNVFSKSWPVEVARSGA